MCIFSLALAVRSGLFFVDLVALPSVIPPSPAGIRAESSLAKYRITCYLQPFLHSLPKAKLAYPRLATLNIIGDAPFPSSREETYELDVVLAEVLESLGMLLAPGVASSTA